MRIDLRWIYKGWEPQADAIDGNKERRMVVVLPVYTLIEEKEKSMVILCQLLNQWEVNRPARK